MGAQPPIKASWIALLATGCLINISALGAEPRPEWLPEGALGATLPMLADPGGLRAALWERGVKYQINYVGDLLSNRKGGLRRGSAYSGLADLELDADLEKGLGWKGASFYANLYQIHGSGLTRSYVGNLMPVSEIEALPATRLYEIWIEQKLAEGKITLRVGQMGADTEFLTSAYAIPFLNGTFGWPLITNANLPSGGPAYPLATPGLRLDYHLTDQASLLIGLFNGDPSGTSNPDPQIANRHGLNFRIRDPAFVISELQYKYGDDKSPAGLSGDVKVGAWNHFGKFADQRYDAAGLALAISAGDPLRHRGDHGIYGVIDQQIYRHPDDPAKGLGLFARLGATPNDRNLINFYVDVGLNASGMIPGRQDDIFGLAAAYAQISPAARGFNQDDITFNGDTAPVRTSEMVIEATYAAQIIPGWTLQPDFQYIMRPGASAADPNRPYRSLKNAVVVGLRTSLKF